MAFKSDQSHFSNAPQAEIQRSGFDRSHTHTTTFDAGYLIPFYVDEVLPGDTFKADCSLFARMLTPIVPFMDNVYLDTHFFFVPARLLWDHWENMHGTRVNPDDSIDYICPTIDFPSDEGGAEFQSIYDYMGVPPGISNIKINALPFRAYNRIWNEWFRDANLQDEAYFSMDDGGDTPDKYQLLRRGKRHDYFTSCLPWPQMGDQVEVPIGDFAPVIFGQAGVANVTFNGATYSSILSNDALNKKQVRLRRGTEGITADDNFSSSITANTTLQEREMAALYTDLSSATAISINSLRQAFQLQRLLERDARGGANRYTTMLEAHFGVKNPDARLQRSEYLGGGSTPLSVFSVAQTSASSADETPQGNLSAYATAGDSRHVFTRSFSEYGYIIGFVSVRADLHYQQGLHKMFSRSSRFDFYYPALAHLGEQAVLNKEIYLQGNLQDDEVFGYQERWAEYRYFPSMITGKLRSTFDQPLDYWHLAQEFEGLPTLSPEFIEENPPIDRVVAMVEEPQFKLDSLIKLKCWRPMPVYSVPGLVDHF